MGAARCLRVAVSPVAECRLAPEPPGGMLLTSCSTGSTPGRRHLEKEIAMSEPVSYAPATADVPDQRRLRRAGQTALTLFVVFVVSLLAFGQPAMVRTATPTGYALNFNLLSTAGVIGGILAPIYLLTSLRHIRRLRIERKVFALVGSLGLIAHTILALI